MSLAVQIEFMKATHITPDTRGREWQKSRCRRRTKVGGDGKESGEREE